MNKTWKTKLIHTDARAPDGFASLVTPVYRGSTTLFASAGAAEDRWDHDEAPYTYGLYGTPTTLELAARIAELEGGHRTFLTPGGQSAIALIYLAFLQADDHVLVPQSIYGPNAALAAQLLTRFAVDVEFYPPLIGGDIADLIKPNTRLIWCESPGSVTMEVQDIPAIALAAHRRGVLVALDNTWAAGIYLDAFGCGADITMQALTKYVGGHSDLLLGSVTVKEQRLYKRLGSTWQGLGLAVSPDECSLALRGMQTLGVRLAAIEQSALEIARWLGLRPEVQRVLHPALPSCPGCEIWQRDFSGSTGAFSIVLVESFDRADVIAFVDGLNLFKIGYSWGGATSLAVPFALGPPRAQNPYGNRLVRINVGLEETVDLIADLEQSLNRLALRSKA
jgi:cysteine-S-conjugate beta-lyase